ncbi:MAG: ABC transporter permease subunit [Deltaproteobacteria bacterium]|nr:ABC transporter permease subunit [Deltaproteobacteria bacterium]
MAFPPSKRSCPSSSSSRSGRSWRNSSRPVSSRRWSGSSSRSTPTPRAATCSIPSLCWSILGLLWFGLTEAAAVFVIAAIAFPVVVINVHEGVKNVDPALTKMAAVYRVPGRRVVSGLYLPSIFPYILSASRYGLGLSWKIAIIAEMLGMSSGVGFAIHYYYNLLNMEQVLAWTLLFTGVIIFVDQVILKRIEGVVMRWREA